MFCCPHVHVTSSWDQNHWARLSQSSEMGKLCIYSRNTHTYMHILTHSCSTRTFGVGAKQLPFMPGDQIKEVPLSLENGMQISKLIVSEREWVVKNNIIIIITSLYLWYSCSNITLWSITNVFGCSKLLSMWENVMSISYEKEIVKISKLHCLSPPLHGDNLD